MSLGIALESDLTRNIGHLLLAAEEIGPRTRYTISKGQVNERIRRRLSSGLFPARKNVNTNIMDKAMALSHNGSDESHTFVSSKVNIWANCGTCSATSTNKAGDFSETAQSRGN